MPVLTAESWKGSRLFYGVSLPQEASVARLVDAVTGEGPAASAAPSAVHELGER